MASGGFGAQVTANTPVALKNFLGGGAYTLSGVAQALNFVPYHGELRMPQASLKDDVIVGAGSVVRGNIPDNSIVMGNPAVIVDDIKEHTIKTKNRVKNIKTKEIS